MIWINANSYAYQLINKKYIDQINIFNKFHTETWELAVFFFIIINLIFFVSWTIDWA